MLTKRNPSNLLISAILVLNLCGFTPLAHAQAGRNLTSAQVNQAIARGIEYLQKVQSPEGGWDEYGSENCGASALVTLALLNSGVSPAHPSMTKALNYLRAITPNRTYSVALQTMVFCAANPNEDLLRIKQNVQWLTRAQQANGMWGYEPVNNGADPSNTQFALLALSEAQRIGVPVEPRTYEASLRYWLQSQGPDGGWSYNDRMFTGSMTAAGITSVVITVGQLGKPESGIRNNQIECCGKTNITDDPIDKALDWLGRNFKVFSNPGGQWQLYYLYGLERVGRLTGQRFIGEHDWYREGAAQLLAQQDRLEGFFTSTSGFEAATHINTALALLFLSKGKRQIVISRLEYGASNDWNQHRFAVPYLTGHIEQAWKRDLTWQTISLEKSSLADLLESPVLFISGRDELQFNAEQKALLKQYVEQGGFIFAEACNGDGCRGEAFDTSFRNLVQELFGQPLQKLPPSHPIWFAEATIDPKTLPENFWLYGIDACCRTSIVYSPIPLSCRWELNPPMQLKRELPPELMNELDNATKIGLNVTAYATGRQLKEKLDAVQIVRNDMPATQIFRGHLTIPKLQHAGGANDAPRTIPNLLQWFLKEQPADINSQPLLINAELKELEKYPVVFMHGRNSFSFTNEERAALKTYLERGGFLFADSICASSPFAESFRKEMALILPDKPLQPLPATHPLLTEEFTGFDIRKVNLIDPMKRDNGGVVAQKQEATPELEHVALDDRIAVVFSPLDLSCALESQQSLQCKGYTREDAAKIGINIILYAMLQ
jgi:hypothetical protein